MPEDEAEEALRSALDYFETHSPPFDPAFADLLGLIYSNISLEPDSPPFTLGQWGFVQFSNALDDRELMGGLVHRIPGGQAELEKALARPRRHLTAAADVLTFDLPPERL